jgi:hypothetical protein
MVAAADLVPHPQNWRQHPQAQATNLTATLGGVGWVQRVIVNQRTGRLLDGHLRAELARAQGEQTPVPVLYVDLSEDEERTVLATLDPIAGMAIADEATLAGLVRSIEDADLRSVAGSLAQTLNVAVTGDDPGDGDNEDARQVEDFPVSDLLAPYPYFGGKRAIAGAVWARFGQVENYVEPFFGSGAMLLSCPNPPPVETVNDLDGFIANFWRAVAADPAAVAQHVDWPVNENDLFARHLWLVNQRASLTDLLHTDPTAHDVKIAGWWCWGACNWIGTGWCDGDGPWQVDGDTVSKLPHAGDAGRGVNRKLPHAGDAGRGVNRKLPHAGDAGRGVNRQLPHAGNAGRGVNRQLPHAGDAGRGVNRQLPHAGDAGRGDPTVDQCAVWTGHLQAMMQRLSDRLRRTRVACGDWSRVVTSSITDRHGLTAVFLDPPYAFGAMEYSAGGNNDAALSDAVRAWCIENGANPQLRIAFCGYEPLAMPAGWRALRWSARKGYQNAENAANRHREIIWFSPTCLTVDHA